MQEPIKKQYVTPTLIEHGVVRELTQSGSGSRPHKKKHKRKRRWRWWPWW
jgi:hypothetical protein